MPADGAPTVRRQLWFSHAWGTENLNRITRYLDQWLASRSPRQVLLRAVVTAVAIGYIDYATGYEASMGLFYITPVAITAWYVGRRAGIGMAVACAIIWFIADINHDYSHTAFRTWNALIRLGFFLVSGLLLSALRASLTTQQQLARTDSLTGLLTRRAFEDRLEHDLVLAQRSKQPLTLAYIDLDDFKRINDEQGHAAGDRVLRVTADVMRRMLRRADTVARLGGDEFALVLPNTDGAAAHDVISNVTQEIRTVLTASGLELSCSVGVITIAGSTPSLVAAVAAADALMYRVKHRGKGRIEFAAYAETENHAVSDAASGVGGEA